MAVSHAIVYLMSPGSFVRHHLRSVHPITIDTIPVTKALTARRLWLVFDSSGETRRLIGCGNSAQIPDNIVGASKKIEAIPKQEILSGVVGNILQFYPKLHVCGSIHVCYVFLSKSIQRVCLQQQTHSQAPEELCVPNFCVPASSARKCRSSVYRRPWCLPPSVSGTRSNSKMYAMTDELWSPTWCNTRSCRSKWWRPSRAEGCWCRSWSCPRSWPTYFLPA